MSLESLELQNLDAILALQRAERAAEWSEADFFTFFVSEQLLKNTGASVEELVDSIVDGGNDCGVDSITYLINESPAGRYPDLKMLPSEIRMQIIIVQSKSGLSFEERPLLEMAARLPRLLDSTRDEDEVSLWCNPALQEQTKRFLDSLPLLLPKFPQVAIKVYYASRSVNPPHPKVISQGKVLTEALLRNPLFATADVEFLQAHDILAFARQQLRTTFRIRCVTQPMASPDGSGYVGFVSLPAFKTFVSTENGDLNTQLFESNVRDHEGRTEVNAAIQASLSATDSSDDFWWLNNGVTILASKTMANGHELELESPQVVNGLQTSTEVWLSRVAPSDSRLLLIRVIKTVDSKARDRIIQATNYQTAIPTSALRATDPIQRDIEEWFLLKGLYYDRRRNYYFNRSHPISDIVSMPRLAEAIASCLLQEPHKARMGGNGLMSDDATYEKMFTSRNAHFYLKSLQILEFSKRAVSNQRLIGIQFADDWYFLLATAASILLTRRDRPTDKHIADLDLSTFDTDRLADLIPLVSVHLAGSRASKSPLKRQAEDPRTADKVVSAARSLIRNSRWTHWPAVAVENFFVLPSGRFGDGTINNQRS